MAQHNSLYLEIQMKFNINPCIMVPLFLDRVVGSCGYRALGESAKSVRTSESALAQRGPVHLVCFDNLSSQSEDADVM